MDTALLVIWLASGAQIRDIVSARECDRVHAEANAVLGLSGVLVDPSGDAVTRVDCGGRSTVLLLPESGMPCALGDDA